MWKNLRHKLWYWLQYVPFTLNALLCGLAFWAGYALLYTAPARASAHELDSFRPFVVLMGKLLFWLILSFVALAMLSALATWAWYLYLRRRGSSRLQLEFINEPGKGRRQRLYMQATIEGVRRPLFGFVKARLIYDDYQSTDAFPMLSDKRQEHSFWRSGIRGRSRLMLPDVREYAVRGAFVYFEDLLRIFALPVAEPVKTHFYQPPLLNRQDEQDVFPQATETLDVRIEQMRRVEGEPLNYKDFEAGDDVRRIVWKVYARNRELVVRVPERFEPYASHLYFYASFAAAVRAEWLSGAYLKEMLNYYKNAVWTVYDMLAQKEWDLRYVPDQPHQVPEHLGEAERAARIISNSEWLNGSSLQGYYNPAKATVLCISSLQDPADVAKLLDRADSSTLIYYAKLSRTFRQWAGWTWFKRLLFLPPKDRLSKLRATWPLSPVRWQLKKREKVLEQVLEESGLPFVIV